MLLLTFTVGPNQYAIDVVRIIEVVPRVELRQISHATVALSGLLDYRGNIVPVIDLGQLLGEAACRDRLSTRVILVNDAPDDLFGSDHKREDLHEHSADSRLDSKRNLNLLGLVAESVSDLTSARPEQVLPAPVSLPETPYLGAIVQTDRGLVQLIMVERVREAALRSSRLAQPETLNSLSDT